MPAHSSAFPRPSYYGHYQFFEERMAAHRKINEIKEIKKGLYDITRSNGAIIRVFVCECYSFGVAEYYETVDNFGSVDAIIINSNWCGYTIDCKSYCIDRNVGLFDIRDFMAALNTDEFWKYARED